MPVIKVTAADLAKTKNLEPGWYGAKIVRVNAPKTAAKGDSINYGLDFLIEGGNGKEIPFTLNTKLMGKVGDIYKAIYGKDMQPDTDFDLDEFVGKVVDVKIQQQIYNGAPIDNIMMFLPHGKSKEALPF